MTRIEIASAVPNESVRAMTATVMSTARSPPSDNPQEGQDCQVGGGLLDHGHEGSSADPTSGRQPTPRHGPGSCGRADGFAADKQKANTVANTVTTTT